MAITIDQIHQTNEATLTSMEKKFCEGIAQGKGKRTSAVDAGYSETSAHVQAARNLKKDKIIQYIDRLRVDARRLTSECVTRGCKARCGVQRCMQQETILRRSQCDKIKVAVIRVLD